MGGDAGPRGRAARKTLCPAPGTGWVLVGSTPVLPGEAGLRAGPTLGSPPGHSGTAAPRGQVSEGWVRMACVSCAGPGGRAPRGRRAGASGGPTEASGRLCDAGVGSLEAGSISKHRRGEFHRGLVSGEGAEGHSGSTGLPAVLTPPPPPFHSPKGPQGRWEGRPDPSPYPARDPGTRELHWPQGLQSPCQGISPLPFLVRLVGSRGHDRWKFWKR